MPLAVSSSPPSSFSSSFVCVHCGTSCGSKSLYRYLTLNSPASIQLTVCISCGNVADPYLEREGLLVAMDWILLRPPAYRHVLCNQLQLYLKTKTNINNSNATMVEEKEKAHPSFLLSLLLRRMICIGGSASAMLESYVQWQQQMIAVSSHVQHQMLATESLQDQSLWHVLQLVLVAWLGRILVWGIITTMWIMIVHKKKNFTTTTPQVCDSQPPPLLHDDKNNNKIDKGVTEDDDDEEENLFWSPSFLLLAMQIYLALLLPTVGYVLAVVVMIWEHTLTVFYLTSVLVLAMQFTALSSLLLHFQQSQQAVLLVFIAGLLIRMAWRWLLVSVVGIPLPCLGWSLPLHDMEPWSNVWWEHSCIIII